MMQTALFLGATLLVASSALAQAPTDEHTTFLARFDKSPAPDYCAGDWRAGYSGEVELVEGKFGSAASLDERQRLTYRAAEKINPQAGTIELWLKCTWEPGTVPDLHILSFRTPSNCYLNFNSISRINAQQLGAAFQGGPEDAHVWKRVGLDPSAWVADQWYHLAAVWDGNVIQFYANGELVAEVTDAAAMVGTPEEFTVGAGPLVIDELRISNVARTADEIASSASPEPQEALTTYLTDLEPADQGQAVGAVGFDVQHAIDDREMPLVIGTTAYARGIALRAPGYVEYAVPEGFARLTGQAGASAFSPEGRAVALTISADGEQLFSSGPTTPGSAAARLDVSVADAKNIRLEAKPAGDEDAGAVGIFADLLLAPEGAQPPPPFAREMAEEEIALQRLRTQVAEFRFELPEAPNGYVIYPGHPVDMIDPTMEPLGESFPERMRIAAAPGEYEAVQFIICAARDMPGVRVTCGALRGPVGEIPDPQVDVRLIRRVLQRRGYWMDPDLENYDVVSRFLFPNREFWLPAGNLKEAHIIVHVPDEAQPGTYQGTISVAPEGMEATEFALELEVLPVQLVEAPDKRYGMYYTFTNLLDNPEVLHAELADMAAHGCTTLCPHVGIAFERAEDGTITWSYDHVRALLEAMRQHGGHGAIVVQDSVFTLARLMGLKGVTAEDDSEPLAENEEFCRIIGEVLGGLKQVEAEFPEFEVVLTHMDEVFGRNRMPRFIDAAKVVKQTPGFRFYETLHTMPGRWEEYMEQSDPYIDIRCMNGHALDEWLKAGHTFEELAQMLEASGDEGWTYYNMRGSFFVPEWNRIVNGLYMWLSPLTVHVPWKYYAYGGSPFDDTDSERYDFGYAFPSDEDPTQLISTLHWEAFRQGCDDMRYIATLEDLVRRAEEKGVDAGRAKAWLNELRGMIPRVPDDIAEIDLESPLLVAISEKFSGADYDRMRWHTATQIIDLRKALGE